MASILFHLDERTKKDGMCPVRLRINHNHTAAYIPTRIYVEPECFVKDSMRDPITRSGYMWKQKTDALRMWTAKFDKAIDDIEHDDSLDLYSMTATDVRAYIIGERVRAPKKENKPKVCGRLSFLDWFDTYAQSRRAPKTVKSYEYILRILAEYAKSRGTIHIWFDELEYALFVDIREWLIRTGRGESTRHQVEAYMHAAWRDARRRKMVTGDDPWLDYKIERVEPSDEIDYADIDDLRRLARADFSGVNGEEWLTAARDMLLLSYYCCGANLMDLYDMPKARGGELVFVRHKVRNKTKKAVHIRVEPEMQVLLDKYAGTDKALRFAEQVPNWDTFQRKVIDRLARVGELEGVRVGFAQVRRSWATYAARLDFSDRVIDKSMGHMDSSILNKHYASYDWSKTASCNRAMIDFLWQ